MNKAWLAPVQPKPSFGMTLTIELNILYYESIISIVGFIPSTLIKFWRYNKASFGELVPLEILGPGGGFSLYPVCAQYKQTVHIRMNRYWRNQSLLYRQNFMRVKEGLIGLVSAMQTLFLYDNDKGLKTHSCVTELC